MISERDFKEAEIFVTEFTVDQALQQGIEAHKTGKVQEADRLYTAILKAQPRHPDANHNMGVWLLALVRLNKLCRSSRQHWKLIQLKLNIGSATLML